MSLLPITRRWAHFSPDRRYRYALWREWTPNPARVCCFVMLNPSTADEEVDDATIRRCMAFAQSWGDDMLLVLNLFALRSTDPRVLRKDQDSVGPSNDGWLQTAAEGANRVVLAWGAYGSIEGRGDFARANLLPKTCWSFGLTANGQPRHPLYVRGTAQLVRA